MRNLFIRLYVLLALTFLGIGWSLDQLYDQFAEDTDTLTDLDIHRGTLLLLNRELERLTPESRDEYVTVLQPSFGFPVALVDKQSLFTLFNESDYALTREQLLYLDEGGQISVFSETMGTSWFLQKQGDSDQVIVLGPIALPDSQYKTLLGAVFLLVLALIVFAWVWPLSKGIVTLTKAAEKLGQGDFSIRIDGAIAKPLQPLATRFNAMADRIQRLIRSHKELSHAVSHELRTPIARIRFAMEMAREVPDESQKQHYFTTVDNNIEELDELVDELLTFARFDREEPKLHFEYANVETIVKEVVARFEMVHTEFDFVISNRPETPVHADCDKDAIARVVDNLIRNAVRYAKSKIEISVFPLKASICISVCDDGPGIPQQDWESLFDPFVRLDRSRDRNSGGIGLGLAIVRRYMEWHRGNAKVGHSDLGGAKFVLSWPYSHE